MNSPADFLAEVEAAGFRVSADAGRLIVEPASKLPPELLGRIKARRKDLLDVALERLPTLAELAELDSLIAEYGRLVHEPESVTAEYLRLRRCMAPNDVRANLDAFRRMVADKRDAHG